MSQVFVDVLVRLAESKDFWFVDDSREVLIKGLLGCFGRFATIATMNVFEDWSWQFLYQFNPSRLSFTSVKGFP